MSGPMRPDADRAASAAFEEPAVSLAGAVVLLAGAAGGALVAALALPNLAGSLLGPEPRAFWYLSRASGLVAFALLWLAMALGLSITNRMARVWPGGPTAFDLHQHASLLSLGFALFHGLVLAGDRYVGYTLAQLLVPFASVGYRPVWVGLGQVGIYLLALVGLSFYVRGFIGRRLWRLVHFLSFAVFMLALVHGVASGTDSGGPLARSLYWGSGGSLVFLTVYRVLVGAIRPVGRAPAGSRAARPWAAGTYARQDGAER